MRYLIALVIAGLFAGCGVTTKSGTCKDYRPIDNCDDDYVYDCVVTDDGCEQCGCVRRDDADGRLR
jgi:hypothetical protein